MPKYRGRKLLDRLFLRHELPIMLFLALLPEVLMLGVSYFWIENRIEREMSFLADATARRADKILKVTQANLKQIAEQTKAECDQSAMAFMRDKVFKVMYIREIGIINDKKLICNDVKMFEPPVLITTLEQTAIAEKDGDIALVPPMPTLQGGKSILVNYRVNANRYVNALIDPDIFAEFHEYVRLGEVSDVLLVRQDGKAVVSFGSMSEQEIPPLSDTTDHVRYYRGNLLSIYKSTDYPIFAVVSASPAFIIRQWTREALYLLVMGGIISIALVLLLKRNRRHSSLLEHELWQAIENNQFCVHYQPMMDMVNKRCVGAEALIRWQHPERGMIPPLVFILIAEQNGMIRHITRWLIERIDTELGDFLKQNSDIHVSVNLSPLDLGADGKDLASDALLFSHIPQQQIIYEITEHSLMPEHAVCCKKIMQELRDVGAKIALDDFGTGYSNLSYLHRFPMDYLKIDKVFVDSIETASLSRGLIDHVVSIAGAMQYQLIAEGIEHEHQMHYLLAQGVKFGQGWYFAKPMPASQFVQFLEDKNG